MIVIKPGTSILLSHGLQGICTAVAIYANSRVMYEVAWWDGRQRCQHWLEASEVSSGEESETIQIGFCP